MCFISCSKFYQQYSTVCILLFMSGLFFNQYNVCEIHCDAYLKFVHFHFYPVFPFYKYSIKAAWDTSQSTIHPRWGKKDVKHLIISPFLPNGHPLSWNKYSFLNVSNSAYYFANLFLSLSHIFEGLFSRYMRLLHPVVIFSLSVTYISLHACATV